MVSPLVTRGGWEAPAGRASAGGSWSENSSYLLPSGEMLITFPGRVPGRPGAAVEPLPGVSGSMNVPHDGQNCSSAATTAPHCPHTCEATSLLQTVLCHGYGCDDCDGD